MNVGIVGHAADKFTRETEARAREAIREILDRPGVTRLVSGGCHLGGVDIWAEEEALRLGKATIIHRPATLAWSNGYKPRNILIAQDSDEVAVVVVADYPPGYTGMRFSRCYHCGSAGHVKSGGCWTAKEAVRLGKPASWVIIPQEAR